jgi:hypothetical protein
VAEEQRLYFSPIGLVAQPSWWGRFVSKIEVGGEEDCWPWTAGTYPAGYGMFGVKAGVTRRAHRLAFEVIVGPIPEGLDLDHLCHTIATDCPGGNSCPHRRCCNPLHMEPVTRRTNVLRGRGSPALRAQQTHCTHGHEFTPENTYVTATGWRRCRACGRDWYHRMKAAA